MDKSIFSRVVSLGLVLSFLALSLSCLHFQEMKGMKDCSKIISVSNYINLNKIQFGFGLFFLLVALVLISFSEKIDLKIVSVFSFFFLIRNSLFKLNDCFIEFFKKGVLHPQKYRGSFCN